MTDSRFENRYLVLKRQDVEKYLGRPKQVELYRLVREVEARRVQDGKEPVSGLFIQSTWPEYGEAASALHKRITGEGSTGGGGS